MAAILVQSIKGGSGTGFVAPGGTVSTSAAGFASPTTAGNFLVCVQWTYQDGEVFGVNPPTISGGYGGSFTEPDGDSTPAWVTVVGATLTETATADVFVIANAPSMSTSQLVTAAAENDPDNGSGHSIQVEFDLYEFSGVPTSPTFDVDSYALGPEGGGSPETPTVSFAPSAATELLIAVFVGKPGSNLAAGSGYTLGINSTLSNTIGQLQYQLGAASGQTSAAFSGTSTNWGMEILGFELSGSSPVVTVTNVSPNNGPIAGGTAVTITGTDFLSGATVDFGGSAATSVVVVSPTSITCVTPAHSAGSVTVSVTDSDGTGSVASAYLYTNPILDVTPSTLSFSATQGGSNPASQDVSVSNGNGGTLAWSVSSDEAWLSDSPSSGTNSGTVVASIDITGLNVGTYTGHLTFSASGATDSPQTVTVTLSITSGGGGGGGGSPTGFTPTWPPVKKQPFTLWGLEAKRADSITATGLKQSVLDHIDTVTTLTFPFVPAGDMAAWKDFQSYALSGGTFSYRPLIGYPNSTSSDPMFQYPGAANGDNAVGFSACQCLAMDWKPHFESFGNFSLSMKLKLVGDVSVTPVTVPATAGPWNYNDPVYPFLNTSFLGSGDPPVSVIVVAGGYLSLTYLAGLVNNHDTSGNYADADGVPPPDGDTLLTSDFPMWDYSSPVPVALSLCGGWADGSGNLVAPPFFIGDNAVLGPAPAGTTQLWIGVNDYPLADNTGSWTIGIGTN